MRRPNPVLTIALIVAVAFTLLAKLDAERAAGAETRTGNAPRGPNVAIEPLRPGEKPPQFILFSFDGSGSHQKWQRFLAAADEVGAQFTGFLSGVYLLTDDFEEAYSGPGHEPGDSSIGFGGTPEDLRLLIEDMNTAYQRGHEIGTHFNGHFCDGNDPSGNDWTTAQWSAELDLFLRFLADHREINHLPDLPRLAFPPAAVQGGRTPCLEGDPAVVFPALAERGLSYDSSRPVTGLIWPQQLHGLWEFGMPVVPVAATGGKNIAMDYNFWFQFNGARNEPARAAEFTEAVLSTYRQMYDDALDGNRAPLVIGNHFNDWSGNAFNPAVEQFMLEACDRPETVCTTYQNVIAWMQAQDPAVLAELMARPPSGG
ncbi:MAG: polysaccharide deacetylase [Geodermatophilaceae bacterium]|nr:polysaccharide deacetylase [Geodermatophilaceae bacterium]